MFDSSLSHFRIIAKLGEVPVAPFPEPDGDSCSLSPNRERLVVWTNRQQQSNAILELVVNWPIELGTR